MGIPLKTPQSPISKWQLLLSLVSVRNKYLRSPRDQIIKQRTIQPTSKVVGRYARGWQKSITRRALRKERQLDRELLFPVRID